MGQADTMGELVMEFIATTTYGLAKLIRIIVNRLINDTDISKELDNINSKLLDNYNILIELKNMDAQKSRLESNSSVPSCVSLDFTSDDFLDP